MPTLCILCQKGKIKKVFRLPIIFNFMPYMNIRSLVSLIAVFGILFNSSVAFSAAEPPQDFFENAWQEATNSTNYSFSCTVVASGIKGPSDKLIAAKKQKEMALALPALQKYRTITQGTLWNAGHFFSAKQEKINTLGVLDRMVAGQLTMDQAAQAIKKASKKTLEILIVGSQVYYRGGSAKWNTFESSEFAEKVFTVANGDPVSSLFKKSSFVYQNGWRPGSFGVAVYLGTLTEDATTELLTPFISEEIAKTQMPSSTKLYIARDGNIKRYEAKAKVVLGVLSFDVKNTCTISFGKAKVKVPAAATPVDAETGIDSISELAGSL